MKEQRLTKTHEIYNAKVNWPYFISLIKKAKNKINIDINIHIIIYIKIYTPLFNIFHKKRTEMGLTNLQKDLQK